MSEVKVDFVTESQLEKLEAMLAKVLEKSPYVKIDENHPEVAHIKEHFQSTTHHEYIKESLANYLDQFEVVDETEKSDQDTIIELFTGFLNGMPEIVVDNQQKLQQMFDSAIKA